jgi:aminotransferase
LLQHLEQAGFRCFRPSGAYYIMADISDLGFADDLSFVRHMIENIGVAAVPGSSFFSDSYAGRALIRFCFCKKYETLKKAGDRLRKIQSYPVVNTAR